MEYKRFFGDMNLQEIRELFLENGFSKEDLEKIENYSYNPYE